MVYYMKNNKVTVTDIKNEIFQYGVRIQECYQELFELSLVGKKDTPQYRQVKENIKLLHKFESRLYKILFDDREMLINFSNEVIYQLTIEELFDFDINTAIFKEPERLLLYRMTNEFERRLVTVKNLNEFVPKESYEADFVFHIFQNILDFKNIANLLLDKMNRIEPTSREYMILSKYYYGVLFSFVSLEENYLSNHQTTYTVADFLENHPNQVEKENYIYESLDWISEINLSYIKSFFQEKSSNDNSILDVLPLYLILIESTFNMIPKEYASDILAQIYSHLETMDLLIKEKDDYNNKKMLLSFSISNIANKYINKKEA